MEVMFTAILGYFYGTVNAIMILYKTCYIIMRPHENFPNVVCHLAVTAFLQFTYKNLISF